MLSMDAIHSMHASGSMPTTYMAAAQHTHSHPQAHPQAHPFIAHHGGSPDMGMMMVQHPPAVHDGLHMPVGASNSSGAAAGEKRGYDEQVCNHTASSNFSAHASSLSPRTHSILRARAPCSHVLSPPSLQCNLIVNFLACTAPL